MSLDVALQSVAFYVLSCSTCAKINHRRKAREKAKRERAEKHELETEQPGLYRHPSPFSTNPYWTEEILMGPGSLKQKDKGGSKNNSQRALNTAGQGSSNASSGALSTEPGSSPTAVTEGSRISGDGWNLKRYQREDEYLWGHDTYGPGQRIRDVIAKAGSSAGRLLEGRLSKGSSGREENPGTYYLARNPPVNDLHPPVVSTQPSSRDQTRWMLQPPPPAKVMEGKERVNRSRAGSNVSSRKGLDGTPLSRQVTERLVDAKIQRGETPYLDSHSLASRTTSRTTLKANKTASNLPTGELLGRSRSASLDSSESSEARMRRSRRPAPISISTSAASPRDTMEHNPIPFIPSSNSTGAKKSPPNPLSTNAIPSSVIADGSSTKGQDDVSAPSELSPASAANTSNSRAPSPLQRLSHNSNAIPVLIPQPEQKYPTSQTGNFLRPRAQENSDPISQVS